jgi:Mn-dependent DtxR family transcriptional regulator
VQRAQESASHHILRRDKMTNLSDVWEKAGQSVTAFSPLYQERMIRLTQKYDSPNYWFFLNWIRAIEPEPFNLDEVVETVSPYSTREWTTDVFNELSESGFLNHDDHGTFTLTDRGRGLIEGFFDNAHEALAEVEPIPADKMKIVRDYLGRIVEAAENAAEPTEKPRLAESRWTDPGPDAPVAVGIDQFATDLYRFRDDVHVAAWKSYGVSGHLWETLTYVWREEASTAAELAERLSQRGYDEADYAKALKKLEQKGWIEEIDERFQVTAEGKRIRQEAEDKTDDLFFASWSVLSETELQRLDSLLTELNRSLQKSANEITWDHIRDTARGITPVTRSAVNPLLEEYFEESRYFYPLLLATGNEPDPYSAEEYINRNPYSNPSQVTKTLEEISEAGLMSNGTGAYRLSKQGHDALFKVNDAFYGCLGDLEVLPEEDLEQAVGFLERLVKASLDAAEPEDKLATVNMANTHPDAEYPWMARIDMLIDDLNAFRDDAHIAAWRPCGVSGRTWETLSFVWQGEVRTAPALAETLTFRGYGEEDYSKSLTELTEQGWIQYADDGYETTDQGKALRLEAEETTNRIFFEPWQVLDDAELTRLRVLLIRMKINLENLAEKVEEVPVS